MIALSTLFRYGELNYFHFSTKLTKFSDFSFDPVAMGSEHACPSLSEHALVLFKNRSQELVDRRDHAFKSGPSDLTFDICPTTIELQICSTELFLK